MDRFAKVGKPILLQDVNKSASHSANNSALPYVPNSAVSALP